MKKLASEDKSNRDYRLIWLMKEIRRHLEVDEKVVKNMLDRHDGLMRNHILDIFKRGTGRSNRTLERSGFYVYKTYYPKTFYKEVTIMKRVPKPVTPPQSVTPEDDLPPPPKKKIKKKKKKKKKGDDSDTKSNEDPTDVQDIKDRASESSASPQLLNDSADELDDDKNDDDLNSDTDSPKKKKDKKKKKKPRIQSPQSVISALAEPSAPPELEMITVTLKRIIKKEKMVPQLHSRIGGIDLDFSGEPTYFYFLFTSSTGIPVMDTWSEAVAEMPSYVLIGQLEKNLFFSFQNTMELLEDHFVHSFNDAFDPISHDSVRKDSIQGEWSIPPLDTIKSTGGFARQMIKLLMHIQHENGYKDNITYDDVEELREKIIEEQNAAKRKSFGPNEIMRYSLPGYPVEVQSVFHRIRSIKEIKENPNFLVKEKPHDNHPVYDSFLKRFKTFSNFILWCNKNLKNKMMINFPEVPQLETADEEFLLEMSKDEDFMTALEEIVSEWTHYIARLLDSVRSMEPDGKGPMPLYQYWAVRVAAFSPIYEDLFKPAVERIIKILTLSESSKLEGFISARNNIKAYYNVSLENTDYLNTAFTEIKNLLKTEKISEMAELLPQVLEHLRVLWALSPHWGSEPYFSQLLDRVKWVVCTKIKRILDVQDLFTMDLDVVRRICVSAAEFMDYWKKVYLITRANIEETECEPRWEFDRDRLFLETDYIATVARSIQEMVVVMQEYLAIFCPELIHSVTEPTSIKLLIKKIWNLTVPIMTADFDIFDYEYSENWNIVIQNFWQGIHDLEDSAMEVIQHSFKSLRSSQRAVYLLCQIQSLEARGKISGLLITKMDDVLSKFKDEIHKILNTYLNSLGNPPIMRYHPIFSGSIAWTRQFFMSVKTSLKVIDASEKLSEKRQLAYQEYQRMIDILRKNEQELFASWLEKDLPYLKTAFQKNLIKLVELGEPTLNVNTFSDTSSQVSCFEEEVEEPSTVVLSRVKPRKIKKSLFQRKKQFKYEEDDPKIQKKMKRRQLKMLKLTGKEGYRYLKKSYIRKLSAFSRQLSKLNKKRKKAARLKEKKGILRQKIIIKRRQIVKHKTPKGSEPLVIDKELAKIKSGKGLKEFSRSHKSKKFKKLSDKEKRSRIREEKHQLRERLKKARRALKKLKDKMEKIQFEKLKYSEVKGVNTIQKRRVARYRKRQEKKFKRKKSRLEAKKLKVEKEIKRIEEKQQKLAEQIEDIKSRQKDENAQLFQEVKDTLLDEKESVNFLSCQKRMKDVRQFEKKLLKTKLEKIDAKLKDLQVEEETKFSKVALPRVYTGCRHDVQRFSWREFIGTDLLFEHGYSIKLNYDPNFQRIVREAEIIDELGFHVPKEILCLATLKKSLHVEILGVEYIVNYYREIVRQISEPQCSALKHFIVEIENLLNMGLTEHTWSSISVQNYTKSITVKLESLGILLSQIKGIERRFGIISKTVKTIDFFPFQKNATTQSFSDLCSDLDREMDSAGILLAHEYDKMAPSMYKLESITGLGSSGSSEQMVLYYRWAENIFFEAMTNMVLHNLILFQEFLLGKFDSKITVTVSLDSCDITVDPPVDVLGYAISLFVDKFLKRLSHYVRWYDGTCYQISIVKNINTGQVHQYAYIDDIIEVQLVKKSIEKIHETIAFIIRKVNQEIAQWQKYSHLWKMNPLDTMRRFLEDKPSLAEFDECFAFYHRLQKFMFRHKGYIDVFCLRLVMRPLVSAIISISSEWKNILSEHLVKDATNQAKKLSSSFDRLLEKVMQNILDLATFQEVLQMIKEIGELQPEAECGFKFINERVHLVTMWKCNVDSENKNFYKAVTNKYEKLCLTGVCRTLSLLPVKKIFYKTTTDSAKDFTTDCFNFTDKYFSEGPGTCLDDVEHGSTLIKEYQDQFETLMKRKVTTLQSEKHFSLKPTDYSNFMSAFEEFSNVEKVYLIYQALKEFCNFWGKYLWVNFVPSKLMEGVESFLDDFEKLPKECKELPIALSINQTLKDFKTTIPLMENLKDKAIRPRHWEELMNRTGQFFDNNPNTFVLENMFNLNLYLYEDIVEELLGNANHELEIEVSISKIKEVWSQKKLPFLQHKKENQIRGQILGNVQEIMTDLDDSCIHLRNMEKSYFAAPFLNEILVWENNLSTASEILTEWIAVQKKWLYLEGIFVDGDVRSQLAAESRKFEELDSQYLKIINDAASQPELLRQCLRPELHREFRLFIEKMDVCENSLSTYLSRKRNSFPRFFFLSDDELLLFLGSGGVNFIQTYIIKVFNNVKQLKYHWADPQDPNCKIEIKGLLSCEEEEFLFLKPIVVEDKVECWMKKLLDEMRETNKTVTKQAVHDFGNVRRPRSDWILSYFGMAIFVSAKIWWTAEMEYVFHELNMGNNLAMKDFGGRLNFQLDEIVSKIRSKLSKNLRKKFTTVLVIDIHARDIVDSFIGNNISNSEEFEWESQLRYYWLKPINDIVVKQCSGEFVYGHEYMGLHGRLVITPLTDRIYLTMTQALSMQLGAAPVGPSGTGKTETVKDLAKAMGILCIVTNCGESMDHISFGKILNGLCQCGAWGCFDEFNRIDISVLSVISTILHNIRNALQKKSTHLMICKCEIPINVNVGIFITMNPGYSGRAALPESVKSLFRPIACVLPDLERICNISLYAEGFLEAKELTKKVTALLNLSKKLLSKQNHYNFGLREIKSVISMAGELKRNTPGMPENLVLTTCLWEHILPKLTSHDEVLFKELIHDLFPGQEDPKILYPEFSDAVKNSLEKNGYVVIPHQVEKTIQLFETLMTRHSAMIVGSSGGGKSVIIKTLSTAQSAFGVSSHLHVLNPKACGVNELFGILNLSTREWTDGLFSKIFREVNKSKSNDSKHYIIFDGDVDGFWVESINSVMDDNKLLTLANGERISLSSKCTLLFEVGDFQYASPATLSRVGVIYVDPKNLGYKPYWERWIKTRLDAKETEMLQKYFEKYIPDCLSFIFQGITKVSKQVSPPLDLIVIQTELNMVTQLCYMLEAFLPMADADRRDSKVERYTASQMKRLEKSIKQKSEIEEYYEILEGVFIDSIYYSLGAAIIKKDRKSFDSVVKKLSGLPSFDDSDGRKVEITHIPTKWPTLYDYKLDRETASWVAWKTLIPNYVHNSDKHNDDVFVPTEDSTKFHSLLNLLTKQNCGDEKYVCYKYRLNCKPKMKRPILLVGESGTSKTATMMEFLRQLDPQKFGQLLMSFSTRTTSFDVQNNIESSIQKYSKGIYGPPPGTKLIAFIDDMNMPQVDEFGTQQPIAFLKMFIERSGLYSRIKDLKWKTIRNFSLFAAMGKIGGGRNDVDPRYLSLFSVFNLSKPSDATVTHIYLSMLQGHLIDFEEEVKYMASEITRLTIEVFKVVSSTLPPTPTKFHYSFNLRDLSRVFSGLLQTTEHLFTTSAQFVRIWHNEFSRVIFDRLCTEADRKKMSELVSEKLNKYFPDVVAYALREPLLFGDYRNAMLKTHPRYYEDLLDYNAVFHLFTEISTEYNKHFTTMNLVLFEDALDHLTRVQRLLRIKRGHCMIIGISGSGKDSIVRLASFAADSSLFSVALSRNYGSDSFKEDLKEMLKSSGLEGKVTTFLLTASQIVNEEFLELTNNLLTVGIINSLFSRPEKEYVIEKLKLTETRNEKFDWWLHFKNKCQDNLHVVLSMNPTMDSFRKQCRSFPGIINNTYIDWIYPWPTKALHSVATKYFKDVISIPLELKEPIIDCAIKIHLSMNEYSNDFFLKLSRKVYLTPKHYLEFVKDYLKLMNERNKDIDSRCENLRGGLKKISEAEIRLGELKGNFRQQKVEVDEKSKGTHLLTEELEEATKLVSDKKALVARKQNEILNNKKLTEKLNREVELSLSQAIPTLENAKLTLESIQEDDIVEMRSFASPPEPVQIVCECMAILLGAKEINWRTSKALMTEITFLNRVKELNCDAIPQKTIHQVKTHLKISKKLNELYKISAAGFNFLRFIKGVISYCAVIKEIKPKKEKVVELAESSKEIETFINNLQIEISTLEISRNTLHEKYADKLAEQTTIQNETDLMERRLNLADQLFQGLMKERERWLKHLDFLKNEKDEVLGNCLLCSAFLSYAGPFTWEFREEMLYEKWLIILKEAKIPVSLSFSIERFLVDASTLSVWDSEGLSLDELSLQNGILTTYPSRFPICIDPQQQAINWIKRKETKRNLKILSFTDAEFLKLFESAVKYGYPVLMPDVDYVDPIIGNVLEQKIKVSGDQLMVEIGGKYVEYDPKFKLYITTKMPNPQLHETLYSKGTVVYFSVTKKGLEDMLLGMLVEHAFPALEESKVAVTADIIAKNISINDLETSIIVGLASSEGNVLDSDDLVKKLEEKKQMVAEVKRELDMAKENLASTETQREVYKPVASCGAKLFFLLYEMSMVNPMYQFSLSSFFRLYMLSIKEIHSGGRMTLQLDDIVTNLTKNVYEYGCTGIFEKHKLLLSLQLVIKLEAADTPITSEEMYFFVNGNCSDDLEKSPHKWLADQGWNDIKILDTEFDSFVGLASQIQSNPDQWKEWCESDLPEEKQMPNNFGGKLTRFEILMLIRCLRIDRVYQCVINYVKNAIGEHYVTPPYISFTNIYQQSTNFAPVIFILSPGSDPISNIMKLAEKYGMTEKFKYLSLGQGQEKLAFKMVEEATCSGEWILIQNCHLLLPFVRSLEKKLEKMTSPHHDFRLWLTTEQSDEFPIGMLQTCFKVVMEPPNGLKFNLRNSFFKIDESLLNSNDHPAFKSLIYILTFFHAVVLERRKYGKVGWNINYDFNESDFSVSVEIIQKYLVRALRTEDRKVPWNSLKCLIGEMVYGGRIIDNYDLRVIMTYIDVYMGDFAFDIFQPFHFYSSDDVVYSIPPDGSKIDYLEYIEKLPLVSPPECYGLHWNAQLGYYTETVKRLWCDLKKLQPNANANVDEGYENVVFEMAAEILECVPEPINISKLDNIYSKKSTPLVSVLTHEIIKFNSLVTKMKTNLDNLRMALKGEIGMDLLLESLLFSLFKGELPDEWGRCSINKNKNLGKWLEFFKKQKAQLVNWVSIGEPIGVWLGGLAFPEAYLTGLVQEACRKQGWTLVDTSFTTTVTTLQSEDDVVSKPENGCYLYGLYLEGARWDEKNYCITKSHPKKMIEPMPLICFQPVAKTNPTLNNSNLPTPVYRSWKRRNAEGEGFVFEASLPIPSHQSIWILQGVCLLLDPD